MINPHVQENLQAIQNTLSNYDTSFLSEDEEDYCPLCIEPMDITDKNFFPCPCGYQICQFCYNNIRQNPELNGRCPACRRKFDDESVRYVVLTPEELKMERAKLARKEKERKQREKEKKEYEHNNRKHLAGTRVIQKNLVYVIGVNPPVPPEEVAATLKSDKYFGQYGKINKIVVNRKAPHGGSNNDHYHHHAPGYGVYITFSSKDDAARCIAQVDGTYMDGRLIKAAYGTTKYCSSYLKGMVCPNPNCMFLHEPGEEVDASNKRELSKPQLHTQNSMNSGSFRNGSEFGSAAASPLPLKAHLNSATSSVAANNDSSASTPVLTPAPAPPSTSNPWGISQTASAIANINLSKPNSSINLPTLNDNVTQDNDNNNEVPSKPKPVSNTNTSSSKKKNSSKEYVDPYDALNGCITFMNERFKSLSNYQNKTFSLRSDAIDQETLKSYPPLFTASNIKISETSENILTQKLVEILAIKPTDYSQSVIQFLQNVSASQPELINLPSVQSFTSANNAQATQTPINNPINPNLAQLGNGGVMGPGTPGPQNVMLQAMQPPQQMQAQPPQQMQQMPMNMGGNANGMFVSPQELAQKQAQPQMAQMQSNNVGSNDLLNQLISGKRLAAAN
ncbi:uncharacterized protein HLK63_J02937 [Nakaseomyces glabratus]|nr:uncharacterized protein GW608_J02937 [Nakaseomyces glabratus]UCS26868.1 uncharacterized protein HLK63_J02937 [Nakaseomyces glabratus]UCS32097.1 uncharacterized protein HLK64_J02937 [Nakaseomyces glabratus]UCS37326.1 uncharacterized protein HLK62_J02937 [Nakaseomyces glabratus]